MSNMDEFPYIRLLYTDVQIQNMFTNLKNINFDNRTSTEYYSVHNIKISSKHLLFINKPMLLINKDVDYEDFGMLSDMFQEKNRMKCIFIGSKMSPYKYYSFYKKQMKETLVKQNKVINVNNLRQLLYEIGPKQCSAFKPSNMVYLIKLFGIKSVLDPCSGWGDRLIAALAMNIRYVGIDPNSILHPEYEKMINFFKHTGKIDMICDTIQNANLPKEKFEMVFTSPPYFKIEKYTNNGEVKDKDENEWFNNFMIPMINKSISHLKNNGYLVLVINQMPYEHYIQKMIDYIYTIHIMYYMGVISYVNHTKNNPQPMWIWKKSKTIPEVLYNPDMIITSHVYNKIKFNVFRDDMLIGGSKQRGLIPMLAKIKEPIIVYAGPPQGYAQIALAYGAKLTHKTVKLYLNKVKEKTELTKYAEGFGNVTVYEKMAPLSDLQKEADLLADHNHYIINFGMNDTLFIKQFTKSLKKVIKIQPARIWLVAGSATILNVLYKIFPKTFFNVVQVGKKIWADQIKSKRTKLYISDKKFSEPSSILPPYPSVSTYDAKLWEFFIKYGKNDDYIWNVGKDV